MHARLRTASFLLALALAASAPAAGDSKLTIDARAAFERLSSLAGAWEGSTGEGMARVEYRLASGGTVVMETLFPGSAHEMISMYHVDGDELVMTHYCAMGNQPRMRLDRTTSSPEKLHFVFTGGSNLKSEADGHIHSGTIEIGKDGRVRAAWDYYEGGKRTDVKSLDLARVR